MNDFINWESVHYRPSIDDETEVTEVVESKAVDCFREYGKIYSVPTFLDVTPNGTILLKRGHAKNYNIHTVIELKNLIPLVDEYPKFSDLKKAVGCKADQVTVKRICYAIEHGGADDIISKWDSFPVKYDEF
jgi:hypothetical protein